MGMKILNQLSAAAWMVAFLLACQDPNRAIIEKAPGLVHVPVKPAPTCITALYGDVDGFGKGFGEGYSLSLAGGTSLPLDWRKQDPAFTDIYPADIEPSGKCSHKIYFTLTFVPPSSVASATLHLTTLGIQDGDNQVYGSDTDIRLWIDGVELPGAFDAIDQFDLANGSWADFVSSFDITIPKDMLKLFHDGTVELQWEMVQTIPGSSSYDAFAIDYCQLTVCPGGAD